ncbi:MAG: hypothetical protein OIF58_15015 [Cohaesibacter sp.]|nr:hypothetical protein [Cohaesibacter sp.]
MSAAQKTEFTLWSLVTTLIAVLALAGWGFAIFSFGYPAIIIPAVTLAFGSLFALVFMTRG